MDVGEIVVWIHTALRDFFQERAVEDNSLDVRNIKKGK